MAAIDVLKTRLDVLKELRASGERSVQHGDTRTEFKSDSEMAAAQADLERQIAALETGSAKRRAFTAG